MPDAAFHLSTRCPRCGDKVSMPPTGSPQLAKRNANVRSRQGVDVYAILHLCTNHECSGSTVGYYSPNNDGSWRYEFHVPRYHAYEAPEELPARPRTILQDANDSRGSPVACTPTAVRAVEAMLAEKGYKKGGLKSRIEKAVTEGKLPQDMADWANEVRENGNVTHTDAEPEPLPSDKDATRSLLFAKTLAEYLFVLPARIKSSRKRNRN